MLLILFQKVLFLVGSIGTGAASTGCFKAYRPMLGYRFGSVLKIWAYPFRKEYSQLVYY